MGGAPHLRFAVVAAGQQALAHLQSLRLVCRLIPGLQDSPELRQSIETRMAGFSNQADHNQVIPVFNCRQRFATAFRDC